MNDDPQKSSRIEEFGNRGSYSDYTTENSKTVGDQEVRLYQKPAIETTSTKDGSVRTVAFGKQSIEVSHGVGDNRTTTSIAGSEKLTKAVDEAVDRALKNGLSAEEAKQFNNLRAYVTNHCADGKFDTNEIGAAIQRANNIAPAKGR